MTPTDRGKAALYKAVAIVGADESDEIGIVPQKSTLQLHAEAARNALEDAGASGGRPGGAARPALDVQHPSAQFEMPYHVGGAPTHYAMACMRHMYQYGTTHEQLAEIAVATRKWAMLNPKAMMRDPITID